MKRLLSKKGLWLTAASLFFLSLIFLKSYPEKILSIPSPEYENIRRFYLWVILIGCGFLAFLGAVLWIKKEWSVWLFPVTVICLGVFYMVVLPPFSAPDEARHFTSAYRLSSQMMGKPAVADDEFFAQASDEEKERISRGSNVLVRNQDSQEAPYAQVNRGSYDFMLRQFLVKDTSEGVTVRFESPVNTTPVVYLPQAFGITAARILHIGYIPLIYMGRLFNLLAFAGIAFLAVRIMPFKKEIFMAVSLLPMTLHLAASLSYDAMLIGLSMVLMAWCFYLAYEKKQIQTRDIVLLALILVLLEPCKIVYLPVTGICLLIPISKFKSKKNYWISVGSVIAVMALTVFLMNYVVLSAWVGDTENVIAWQGEVGYTIADVIHQPYRILMVYYQTLVTQFDYYLTTMLGGFLGNLDPNLGVPSVCLTVLWYVLFISAVRKEGEQMPMKGREKIWVIFLLTLSVCLVLASMLLGWTPKDYDYITGIQGRYFLPLLPLALVLIFDKNLVIKKDLTKSAYYLECFISVYALIRICSNACVR